MTIKKKKQQQNNSDNNCYNKVNNCKINLI